MRTAAVLVVALGLAPACLVPTDEPEPSPVDPSDPSSPTDPTDPRDPTDPTDPPPAGAKRVFVTRGTYTGALTTYVGLADGLAAGDAICQLRAKAAGLTGTWVAWLSSSGKDAVDRITAQGPWVLVGGALAFENRAQLYGEPLVPLDRDERGHAVDPYNSLGAASWTGTRAGGSRHAETCADWTSSTARGLYGVKSATFDWTDWGSVSCGVEQRLICFES